MSGTGKRVLWLRWVVANALGETFVLGGIFVVGAHWWVVYTACFWSGSLVQVRA
jgi:hypothetical protein